MKIFIKKSKTFFGSLALAIIMVASSCTHLEENSMVIPKTIPSALKVEADDYSKIADRLLLYKDGWASLQSNSPKGANWFTDCSETDENKVTNGMKFRNAINKYHSWIQAERPLLIKSGKIKANDYVTMPAILATKKAEMKLCLDKTSYSSSEKDIIVEQIITKYADWFREGKGIIVIPTDDNGTLIFLRIRKQCFEALQSIVTEAISGKIIPSVSSSSANSYANYLLKDIVNIKAGMFLYHKKFNHVAGIQSVAKDINNKLFVTIVESNWDDVWKNPTGQNPFQRIISVRTSNHTEKVNGKNMTVGKFNLDDYYVVKINKDNL